MMCRRLMLTIMRDLFDEFDSVKSKFYIKYVPTAKYKLINNIVQSRTTDLKTTCKRYWY